MSNAKFLISLQTLSPGPCWGALEHTVRRESGRGGISACRDLSCVPSAALAAHHHTQHSARMWVFTWNRQMWGLASLSKCPQATQLGAYTGGEAGGREQRFSTGHLVTVGPNTLPKCVCPPLKTHLSRGERGLSAWWGQGFGLGRCKHSGGGRGWGCPTRQTCLMPPSCALTNG